MKYSNISVLADKLRLLSDYGRSDGITYIEKRPFRGRGINFKVIDSGELRIKIRNNFFIHVNEKLEISSRDIIINGERYPNSLIWHASSISGALKRIEGFLNKPKSLLKLMVTRLDPVIIGKFKISGNFLRDEKGNREYIRMSDLRNIVSAGINGTETSFSFDLSAEIDNNLTPKIR